MALFHSDVIGSLLRPSHLQEARAAHERGAEAFRRIEGRAVNEAITCSATPEWRSSRMVKCAVMRSTGT